MKLKLVFAMILMLVVAVFCLQNATVITVRFIRWEFATSQALVILLAAISGALMGLVIGALTTRRRPGDRSALAAKEPGRGG